MRTTLGIELGINCAIKLSANNRYQQGSLLNQNEPEVRAYISGESISQTSIDKLNTFVLSIKEGFGITTLSEAFDCMYWFRGETATITLKNLVKNAHHATALNSPIFAPFEGYTGVVANKANIRTNYNPATDAIALQPLNAAFGAYFTSERTVSYSKIFGIEHDDDVDLNDMYITPYGSRTRVFSSYHLSLSVANSLGFRAGMRNNDSQQIGVINKTITTGIRAITSIPSKRFRFLAVASNDDGGAFDVNYPDDIQIAFGFLGRSMSQSEINVLVDAIETYIATEDVFF